jgi:hypothetical protein
MNRYVTEENRDLLVMKFPDKPNRIDQAYRSAQEYVIEEAKMLAEDS